MVWNICILKCAFKMREREIQTRSGSKCFSIHDIPIKQVTSFELKVLVFSKCLE